MNLGCQNISGSHVYLLLCLISLSVEYFIYRLVQDCDQDYYYYGNLKNTEILILTLNILPSILC